MGDLQSTTLPTRRFSSHRGSLLIVLWSLGKSSICIGCVRQTFSAALYQIHVFPDAHTVFFLRYQTVFESATTEIPECPMLLEATETISPDTPPQGQSTHCSLVTRKAFCNGGSERIRHNVLRSEFKNKASDPKVGSRFRIRIVMLVCSWSRAYCRSGITHSGSAAMGRWRS